MDMMEIRKNVLEASPHIETETGDYEGNYPAPLRSLKVGLEPIQDLHGYESPWPSGGGKNILPSIGVNERFQDVDISYDVDTEIFTLNGTVTSPGNIPLARINPALLPWTIGNRYAISASVVSGNFVLGGNSGITYAIAIFDSSSSRYIRGDTTLAETSLDGYSGSGLAFDSTGNYQLMMQCWRIGTVFNNLKIRIQFESGSTATAWSPYSNICPISGHSEVSVVRTGKNLLNGTDFHSFDKWSTSLVNYGSYPTSTGNRGLSLPVKSGQAYTLSFGISASSFPEFLYLCRANGSDTSERVREFTTSSYSDNKYTFTAEHGWIYYIRMGGTNTDAIFNTNIEKISFVQLELGSTATSYEPYEGISLTIPLGDTVYGGTVNVTNGILTVDRAMVDLGSLTWNYNSVGLQFYAILATLITGVHASEPLDIFICSQYANAPHPGASSVSNAQIGTDTSGGRNNTNVIIMDSAYSDAVTFKTAMNGVQLCYELATPITVSLTPQQISSLVGENHFMIDGGTLSEIELWRH